jgi:hypothetical protein
MSLIDWSDPDEMLGLLIEYVADETVASHDDLDRADFLNQFVTRAPLHRRAGARVGRSGRANAA